MAIALCLFALGCADPQAAPRADASIPFELINGLIVLPARINGSRPLSVIFDTGAKPTIIDTDRARELGLRLRGNVRVAGTGPGASTGFFVDGATMTAEGLGEMSGPVALAIPLAAISRKAGRRVDGIVGADFVSGFVVDIDYAKRTLTLHDPTAFVYRGAGESIPMALGASGQPTFRARVTPAGRPTIDATLTLDLGASGGLALHSPFVARHDLLGGAASTIRAFGATGTGGTSTGRLGRLGALQIGSVVLKNPVAFLTTDSAGGNASSVIDGRLGAGIARRFRVFLDYPGNRIIFEPARGVSDPFDTPSAGVAIDAEGPDYRTLRVTDVLEDGPAAAAGLRAGDVILTVEGRQVSLDDVFRRFEQPAPCAIEILRDGRRIRTAVTPRILVPIGASR